MLDFEGRFRLLAVEIAHCPLQQLRRVAGYDLSAPLGKIGGLETLQDIAAANRRAESGAAQHVVVDPLTANLAGRGDRVVLIPIQ